jgi:hypothetical protein
MEGIVVVSIYAGDLLTGQISIKLPAIDCSWAAEHRADGNVGAKVKLVGEVLDRFPNIVDQVAPWRCFLAAITDDGAVLQAGPILPHKYSDATGELNLSALGMRGIFARRFLMPVLASGANPAKAVMTWSNLSLGTIAKRMVQLAMSHDGGALPIDLPPDQAGTNTRTFYGYELGRLSQRLQQIEDVEGGPDLAFEPYLTGDELDIIRWRMRAGTTQAPELTQDGDDHEWDRTTKQTSIVTLDVDNDADEMGDRAWTTGQGSETQLLMSLYQDRSLRSQGYPLLEVDETRSSVSRISTLNEHTRALLRRSGRPWQLWRMVVRADAKPVLGTYRVGDWVRVHVGPNHPYIKARAGYHRTRIMAISGSFADTVTLVLAPTLEDR